MASVLLHLSVVGCGRLPGRGRDPVVKAVSMELSVANIPSRWGSEGSVLREDLGAPAIFYPHCKANLGEE